MGGLPTGTVLAGSECAFPQPSMNSNYMLIYCCIKIHMSSLAIMLLLALCINAPCED